MCVDCGNATLVGKRCGPCRAKHETQLSYTRTLKHRMLTRTRRGRVRARTDKILALLERDGWDCAACGLGLTDNPVMDYKVRNGRLDFSNLQLVHKHCQVGSPLNLDNGGSEC